jgi:hypothetical protein
MIDDPAHRVTWMRAHLEATGCADCSNGTKLKTIEHRIAVHLGAEDRFDEGRGCEDMPGFPAALDGHMQQALRLGLINAAFLVWIASKMEERSRPCPEWSWEMQIKIGDPEDWVSITETGAEEPYRYPNRNQAEYMLGICYPDLMRAQRLGDEEQARVVMVEHPPNTEYETPRERRESERTRQA